MGQATHICPTREGQTDRVFRSIVSLSLLVRQIRVRENGPELEVGAQDRVPVHCLKELPCKGSETKEKLNEIRI